MDQPINKLVQFWINWHLVYTQTKNTTTLKNSHHHRYIILHLFAFTLAPSYLTYPHTDFFCTTHLHVRPLVSFTTAVLMKKIQSRSHMTQRSQSYVYTPVYTELNLAKDEWHLRLVVLSSPLTLTEQRLLRPPSTAATTERLTQESGREGGQWVQRQEKEREWQQRDDLCSDAWQKIRIFVSILWWQTLKTTVLSKPWNKLYHKK